MSRRPYHPRGELVEGFSVRSHPLYMIHSNMFSRCTKPSSPSWDNYGGRGITVCQRWHDFRLFVSDMGPKPTDLHTLDRRDNEQGYSPDNCRWATRTEQCFNRRKFKSNTSGHTGVVKTHRGDWHAGFDYEHVRYDIGWFKLKRDAGKARAVFVELFFSDRAAAIASVNDRVRNNSTTRHRGVTSCEQGYIARCTIDGVRHYIGYFMKAEDAVTARETFLIGRRGHIAGRVEG